MFTRRRFMQGSATVLGALSAVPAVAAPALAPTAPPTAPPKAPIPAPVAIDSAETPFFTAHPQHLRLAGSQLARFRRLSGLFAQPGPLRLELHLDASAEVLLDTAMNATGRFVTHRTRQGALQRLIVQSS